MSATEYRKLVVIVWLTVIASMAAIWGPKAWAGGSWDTDDFMRLIQVRDWLGGQAWSDLTQYRLNPPGGTAMHWSRLPDLPLAAVTLAVSPFVPMNDALAVAGMILPPFYFLVFIVIYSRPARLMLGGARSPVGLLVVIAGSAMVTQFAPGRVDHHGLQLIMVMAATALLLLGLARERWRRMIALAGIPIGLSIWIGLEMIALIAAWFAALGLIWCRSGGPLAKQGAIAAGIAALIGVLVLLTSVASAHRWVRHAMRSRSCRSACWRWLAAVSPSCIWRSVGRARLRRACWSAGCAAAWSRRSFPCAFRSVLPGPIRTSTPRSCAGG
jgi:hypothetical protein